MRFCQILGQRVVTEFNYRYSDADPENARIFVGVRLAKGLQERKEIVQQLTEAGYQVSDLPMMRWQNCMCVIWSVVALISH